MNIIDSFVSSKFTMILAFLHLLHFEGKTKLMDKILIRGQMKAKADFGLSMINYKSPFASMLFLETLSEALLDCSLIQGLRRPAAHVWL